MEALAHYHNPDGHAAKHPLKVVAQYGLAEEAQHILIHGAKIDPEGRHFLKTALDYRHEEIALTFLQRGAQIIQEDYNALNHAAAKRMPKAVDAILSRSHSMGNNLFLPTPARGQTALMEAAIGLNASATAPGTVMDTVNIVRKILAKAPPIIQLTPNAKPVPYVDVQDNDGNTVLMHLASQCAIPEASTIAVDLLKQNADPTLRNKNGDTALDIAAKYATTWQDRSVFQNYREFALKLLESMLIFQPLSTQATSRETTDSAKPQSPKGPEKGLHPA